MSAVAHFFMSVGGSKFHERLARFFIDIYMLERLNREIRRRTNVVGIFPNPEAYTRLVTTYLMEYVEDWASSRAYLCERSVQALLSPAA